MGHNSNVKMLLLNPFYMAIKYLEIKNKRHYVSVEDFNYYTYKIPLWLCALLQTFCLLKIILPLTLNRNQKMYGKKNG